MLLPTFFQKNNFNYKTILSYHDIVYNRVYMISNSKLFIVIFSIFFSVTVARSQSVVNGKVIDAYSRQPLENASVINESNTVNKTLTDHYGNFSVSSDGHVATLLITYIG